MYNELFEGVIRTSGENTDTDDFNNRDNFWAPIPENLLFERVLIETQSYTFFAIFKNTDKGFILSPDTVSNCFIDVFYEWQKTKYKGPFVILPTDQKGNLFSKNKRQLAAAATYINKEVQSAYEIARNPDKQKLEISQKIFANYINMTDEEFSKRVKINYLNPSRR